MLRVNFAEPPGGGAGGVARYCAELKRSLAARVDFVPSRVTAGALAGVPLLRNLPLAVEGADPAAPLHLPYVAAAGVTRVRRLPPTAVTVHDLGFLELPEERAMVPPAARALLHLSFSALRRVAAVIAVSSFTAASVVRRLGVAAGRVHVVHEGVDRGIFRPRQDARRTVEARFGIGEWSRWRTLLAVGSELPRKRVDLLVDLVAAYRRRGEPVRLLKAGGAGGGRFRARVERHIARLGVGDRVHLLDGVTDAELAALYSSADAYVCASRLEGFSLPTAEALACGAPAVVAAGGALPELVERAALIVDDWTADAWMRALDRLFGDAGLRAGLAEAALARAAAFDWEHTADGTRAVYESLVS